MQYHYQNYHKNYNRIVTNITHFLHIPQEIRYLHFCEQHQVSHYHCHFSNTFTMTTLSSLSTPLKPLIISPFTIYIDIRIIITIVIIIMLINTVISISTTFLTHRYSVGVAVSYSTDFLTGIKLCATMVIVLNPAASFAQLVCIYKVSWLAMFTSNSQTH